MLLLPFLILVTCTGMSFIAGTVFVSMDRTAPVASFDEPTIPVVLVQNLPQSDLPSPVPISTPLPTRVLLPVAAPSLTPVSKSTLILLPTATRPPLPSPTTASTYRQEARLLVQSYSGTCSDLGTLLGQVGTRPAVLTDNKWTMAVAANMLLLKRNGEEIRKLVPPPEWASAHARLVSGTRHIDTALDLFVVGIDKMDLTSLNRAMVEMQLGTADFNEASRLFSTASTS